MKNPFSPPKQKKLHAATARRAREADFTEEPNVKLSSAFIVVLVLHLVAVGGIYAFNALKTHQSPSFDVTDTPPVQAPAQMAAATQPAAPAEPAATPVQPLTYIVKSGDTILKIARVYGVTGKALIDRNNLVALGGIHVGQELTLPAGAVAPGATAAAPQQTTVEDSGNLYTVKSGDTPMSIARKLHVTYADLIHLNNIEDPKKLKIGLKLKVPVRRTAIS
jgi:LysM repeat protein